MAFNKKAAEIMKTLQSDYGDFCMSDKKPSKAI